MAHRPFIGYRYADQTNAHCLNLISYNKNFDANFIGRHLFDPVKGHDSDYISRKTEEKIKGLSATITLIGKEAARGESKEIRWSKAQDEGIVGKRVDPDAAVPDTLIDHGAEIPKWSKPSHIDQFGGAIERAFAATGRERLIPPSTLSRGSR